MKKCIRIPLEPQKNLSILLAERHKNIQDAQYWLGVIEARCKRDCEMLSRLKADVDLLPIFVRMDEMDEQCILRIQKEKEIADIAIECEKFLHFINLIQNDIIAVPSVSVLKNLVAEWRVDFRNFRPTTEKKLLIATETIVAIDEITDTRLDRLPDLALISILNTITQMPDVRNFFWALNQPQSIELECIRQLQICLELNNINSAYSTTCEGDYCREVVMCLRCYLNRKGKCVQCGASSNILLDNLTVTSCANIAKTGTGKSCICSDMQRCNRCGYTFTREESEKVLRFLDFSCRCCAVGTLGCIICTRACAHCANIGCRDREHYRINIKLDTTSDWPMCEDCKKPHCCARRNNNVGEWDFRECPKYEEILIPVNPVEPLGKLGN